MSFWGWLVYGIDVLSGLQCLRAGPPLFQAFENACRGRASPVAQAGGFQLLRDQVRGGGSVERLESGVRRLGFGLSLAQALQRRLGVAQSARLAADLDRAAIAQASNGFRNPRGPSSPLEFGDAPLRIDDEIAQFPAFAGETVVGARG